MHRLVACNRVSGLTRNIGINLPHRVSDMETPNETRCNASNKSISIFVSERRPRCDRISPQTRSYLLPDAFVSPPRCVRFSPQMRSSLLPDALKSIGLELRRLMRPSSTVEARKRRQRKKLRNAVLENRISEFVKFRFSVEQSRRQEYNFNSYVCWLINVT